MRKSTETDRQTPVNTLPPAIAVDVGKEKRCDDDDDDDVMLILQVFLSHRSIYLLLFDLRQDLSTTRHQPMTSSGNPGVSADGR